MKNKLYVLLIVAFFSYSTSSFCMNVDHIEVNCSLKEFKQKVKASDINFKKLKQIFFLLNSLYNKFNSGQGKENYLPMLCNDYLGKIQFLLGFAYSIGHQELVEEGRKLGWNITVTINSAPEQAHFERDTEAFIKTVQSTKVQNLKAEYIKLREEQLKLIKQIKTTTNVLQRIQIEDRLTEIDNQLNAIKHKSKLTSPKFTKKLNEYQRNFDMHFNPNAQANLNNNAAQAPMMNNSAANSQSSMNN